MSHMDPLSTSLSLLERARDGQDTAWTELVRIYAPLVVKWCRQYGIQSCDVDDLTQLVFISVSEHLENFGQISTSHNFRGWLWTIARSKILDYLRKQKSVPRPTSDSQLHELSPIEQVLENDRSTEDARRDLLLLVNSSLAKIRQDFSERTWTAFWRVTAMGESPSQVGQDLAMSASAVCMCRARVVRRLRETLNAS